MICDSLCQFFVQYAREAINSDRPHFVTEQSRTQISGFLAELMLAVQAREWEDSARLSAFGMTTLLAAHFPKLMVFLEESLVSSRDIRCLEATVEVDRFCYHLESLQVSFIS